MDVHSLRHTFATLLSKAGVVPHMAQEMICHRDIRLTTCPPKPWRRSMNVYTHLHLADASGAVEALPTIGAVRGGAMNLRVLR